MQTGPLAKELEVTPNTLRSWAKEYAAHLSPAPPPGTPRSYTPRDVEILRMVRRWRADGAQHDAIAAQLSTLRFGDIQEQTHEETPRNAAQNAAQRIATQPQTAQDTPQLPSLVVDLLRQEIATVRLQTAQAQSQQRDRVTVFLYGLLVGLIVGVLLFWMAYGLAALALR